MRESADELRELQALLDASHAGAGAHLRSIFTDERRMSAEDLVRELRGVFVLHLATVTASGEPRVAPIDGLLYRGRLWFGVPDGAVRIAHLRARPQVSAVHARGEELAVIAHGVAREVDPDAPAHAGYLACCREAYGPEIFDRWHAQQRERGARGYTGRIEPTRLFAARLRPAAPDGGGRATGG